jgi:23S rRNA pseudouridine1911/1915/1917 synthase
MDTPLTILYEDYHCLAVVKPAPLLTQAPPGVPSLEALAKAYLKHKYAKPGHVYLGIPHRLDRPVSGVILFARTTKGAQRLAAQFQAHTIEKVYWALVSGPLTAMNGTWTDYLHKLPEQARSEIVPADTPDAKHAVLDWCVKAEVPGGMLLELRPRTGRMHQLRVQTSSRGLPIWGDVLYGSSTAFGPVAERPRDRLIALHARTLTFQHPTKAERPTVTAPVPTYWPAEVRTLVDR